MKKTIIIVVTIIIAAISVLCQKPDNDLDKNSKAKDQVTALANEYARALFNKDMATMDRILSDDYADLSPDGFPSSKRMIMEYFKVNDGKVSELEDISLDSFKVRIYGNTALMGAFIILKWRGLNKEAGNNKYIVTLLAVKNKGIWQIVMTQECNLPKVTETKKQ